MTKLQGCGTAIVTPMQPDGALDLEALRSFVEWQIAEGIDFLVPCGTTGEAVTLSPDERRDVVRTVVETAKGRVKVIAGATSNDTKVAVSDAKAMADAGADYILSATPPYNKPTAEGLYRHFGAVADGAGRPVVLYNVPGRTSVNMDAATTLRLAAREGIAAIKEASGNFAQIMQIVRGCPESFSVLSGDDATALPFMAVGGNGVISVASNEVPAGMAQLAREALAGDYESARTTHYRLLPLMNANFLEPNPIPVKAALHAMGRIPAGIRLPLVPLSETHRPALLSALREAGALE